jgi:hypothetical protein
MLGMFAIILKININFRRKYRKFSDVLLYCFSGQLLQYSSKIYGNAMRNSWITPNSFLFLFVYSFSRHKRALLNSATECFLTVKCMHV